MFEGARIDLEGPPPTVLLLHLLIRGGLRDSAFGGGAVFSLPRLPGSPERPSAVPVCYSTASGAVMGLAGFQGAARGLGSGPERVRKYLIHYRAPFILKRVDTQASKVLN